MRKYALLQFGLISPIQYKLSIIATPPLETCLACVMWPEWKLSKVKL